MSLNSHGEKGYKLDLTMRQSTTFGYFTVSLKNSDESPVNLEGCSISAKIRKNYFNGTIYTLNSEITDSENGTFTFGMDADDTFNITAGENEDDPESSYVWDLDITYSNGVVKPLFFGKIYVLASI